MDLNELLGRHQISLMRADAAACTPSRDAHAGMARGYAERIASIRNAAQPGVAPMVLS